MAELDLRVGEQIIEEVRGDYWEALLFTLSQKRGKFIFTNQRIHVAAGFLTALDLEYKDIQSVEKCNVGGLIRLIPTGIKVIMKNGKKHHLSILKRAKYIEMINQNL